MKLLSEISSSKNPRSCNLVQFCPSNQSLLLCGLDKVKNDCCLLVWDLSRTMTIDSHSYSDSVSQSYISVSDIIDETVNASTTTPPPQHQHNSPPLAQFGLSDIVNSAAWMSKGNYIVAGMGYRFIRLFDVRGINLNSIFQFQTK